MLYCYTTSFSSLPSSGPPCPFARLSCTIRSKMQCGERSELDVRIRQICGSGNGTGDDRAAGGRNRNQQCAVSRQVSGEQSSFSDRPVCDPLFSGSAPTG